MVMDGYFAGLSRGSGSGSRRILLGDREAQGRF